MHEVTIRIDDGSTYSRATAETGASVNLWCGDHADLLYVRGGPAAPIVAAAEAEVGIDERVIQDREALIVTADCLKHHTDDYVERYLEEHDCLLVPPIRYADGAKFCRVLAVDADRLGAFYRDLAGDYPVTVESKGEVSVPTTDGPTLRADTLLPDLSPRQREVLLSAYDAGYYQVPRETTVAEVAEGFGIDRRTAEDHLRRAENKLLDAVVEYLR